MKNKFIGVALTLFTVICMIIMTVSIAGGMTTTYKVTLAANNGTDTKMPLIINGDTDTGASFDIPSTGFTYGKCQITSWNTKADGSGYKYGTTDTIITYDDITLYAQWTLPLDKLDSFTDGDLKWTVGTDSSYTLEMSDGLALLAGVKMPAKTDGDKVTVIVDGDCKIKGDVSFEEGAGSYGGNYRCDLTVKGSGSLELGGFSGTGSNGDSLTVETDVKINSNYLFLGASGGTDSHIVINNATLTTYDLTVLHYLKMVGNAKLKVLDGVASFNGNANLDLSDNSEIYIGGNGSDCVLVKELGDNSAFDALITNGWIPGHTFGETGSYYSLLDSSGAKEKNAITIKKPTGTPTDPVVTFTVTFVDWDGTVLKTETVAKNTAATAPSDPFRSGFTFTGWNKTFTNVTESMTVTATYVSDDGGSFPELVGHTVTFVDWNGTVLKTETVVDGTAATAPSDLFRDGYTFVGWDKNFSNVKASMTVTAVYTSESDTGSDPSGVISGNKTVRYTVKFNTNGGSKIEDKIVARNTKLARPEDPTRDGYIFDGWFTDKALETEYDFGARVTRGFTLYARWIEIDETDDPSDTDVSGDDTLGDDTDDTSDENKGGNGDGHDCPSLRFDDLDITLWYHLDTDFVIERNIFRGITEKLFAPDGNITRGMMIAVLYRAEGEPDVELAYTFEDVDADAYYAKAVAWGQKNGIIMGYSETEYAPEQEILREQIAAIMYRYAKYKGIDVSIGEETNILSYDDYEEISEYAIPAMQWAVGIGMIKGRTESTLAPREYATRVEIAAMIHRFIENNRI